MNPNDPAFRRGEVEIVRVGHLGDGETADGLYVPLTVVGDRALVEIDGNRGRLLEIIAPGPGRTAPPCRHFGVCGGCALQHMAPRTYSAWKVEQIRQALAYRSIVDIEMRPLVEVQPRSRRRATFAAKLTREGIVLGFLKRGTDLIVDLAECHVIDARLEDLLPKLRDALAGELPRSGRAEIAVTLTDGGIDLTLDLPGGAIDGPGRERLAQLASRLRLARLTVNGDLVSQTRPPSVDLDGVPVELPPGAFLQAVPAAQAAMQSLVAAGAVGARRVADLFAGLGTFAFTLARTAAVSAYEADIDAVSAMADAARRATGLKPILVERRDLFRRPLLAAELDRFDTVVLDPPRAGAKAQCAELARSKVARVVMVSCSAATFARDARTLIDGGYRLEWVAPIDQFLWAAHVELVAAFGRRAS